MQSLPPQSAAVWQLAAMQAPCTHNVPVPYAAAHFASSVVSAQSPHSPATEHTPGEPCRSHAWPAVHAPALGASGIAMGASGWAGLLMFPHEMMKAARRRVL